jgi:glycosyltransferase involved in cell wall biosynthesis
MHASYPVEISQLEHVVRSIAGLTDAAAVMQHHSSFQAAHAALNEEHDAARRRDYLSAIERLVPAGGPGRVFLLSFLVSVSDDGRYLLELHRTLSRPEVTLEQRHFFYWQLLIRHPHIRGLPELEPAAVYASLVESCQRALNLRPTWIDAANRDPDSIIVITNQLLGLQHAPTIDCMDYCHVLQTRLGKNVLLINTADMPWTLQLPYYNAVRFNHTEEYSKIGKLNFKGQLIDFYQCRNPMPNLAEIRGILGAVLSRKPSFVLSLGHSNVAADVCARFLTVATMPFGTNLPRAKSNVFILPRRRKPEDAAFMQEWSIRDEQIVEAEYTFRLPERTASVTGAELGLPKDAYVIAVVGNRLAEEITDAVAAQLAQLLVDVPRAFIAFLGTFPSYARLHDLHPILRHRSAFLGYHKDVLAVYEHCDAYFNPPRYGGGSSAAFALAMGLPVLTGDSGDVPNIAGPDFVFASFDDIKAYVERMGTDADHRREWAMRAKARFAAISDREGMLRQIIAGAAARSDLRVS